MSSAPFSPSNRSETGLEKLAFQFCKIATAALILGRFTLPVAATVASILFLITYLRGQRESRCFVRLPLLISGLWAIGAAVSWLFIFRPDLAATFRSYLPF